MLQPMTPVSPICEVACDGFVVREFVQPPGLKIPRHAHNEATLVVRIVQSKVVAEVTG